MDPSVVKNMVSRPEEKIEGELKCLACNGDLEEGYLPSGHYSVPLRWFSGEFPRFSNMFASRTKYKVKGYRCKDCGRLEQYANPENG